MDGGGKSYCNAFLRAHIAFEDDFKYLLNRTTSVSNDSVFACRLPHMTIIIDV